MSDFAVWNEIGNLYMKIGAYDDAIGAYRRAIEFSQELGWLYSNQAQAYCQKGEYDVAVSLFQKSLELLAEGREKATTWTRLGDAYRQINQYDNAAIAFKEADILEMKLNISSQGTAENKIENPQARSPLENQSQPKWGTALEPARPLSRGESMRSFAAGAGVTENRPVDTMVVEPVAPGASDVASSWVPAVEPVYQVAPEVKRELPVQQPEAAGQVNEDAVSVYQKITQSAPTNDRAWDTLGKLLKAEGRYHEAAEAFERAISLYPTREVYVYHLGLVFAAQKRHPEAINAFQRVIEMNPDDVLAHCALAGSYRRMGMNSEAELHIAIARPHLDGENEYNRACFEAICGDANKAIELLKVALADGQTSLEWVRSDPDLDPLREDERFIALLGKLEV